MSFVDKYYGHLFRLHVKLSYKIFNPLNTIDLHLLPGEPPLSKGGKESNLDFIHVIPLSNLIASAARLADGTDMTIVFAALSMNGDLPAIRAGNVRDGARYFII